VKILRSKYIPHSKNRPPGTICGIDDYGIEVCTGKETIYLTEIQPEGKRVMNATDFANGYLKKDEKFSELKI